jgi:Tfp pilus assembly protein PilN
MIRINLLPEEYRKKARTPVKLLLGMAAAVLFNAGLATWWGWSLFGEQAKVESEKASLQTEMDGLTPQVNHYRSLETEKKQYQSREQTLTSITNSRVSWTRKMDELIDVVNRGGDGQRHLVWFDDLQVSQSTDTKGRGTSGLRANAHSGSEKYAQIANFLEDLEGSPFISDFMPPAAPEGSQAMVDETLIPSIAWSFPLAVTLKPAEERAGAKAAAAKAADPKGADPKGAADKPADPKAGAPTPAPAPGAEGKQ